MSSLMIGVGQHQALACAFSHLFQAFILENPSLWEQWASQQTFEHPASGLAKQ
jgi:hypothetical protein